MIAGTLSKMVLFVNRLRSRKVPSHDILFLFFLREMRMSDTLPSAKHNWIAIIVTLVILGLVALFTWRVVFFANLIHKGELGEDYPSFTSAFSPSVASLTNTSIPLPSGDVDVVTTDDPSLGKPGAPVTIVEFADFGCPYSRASSYVLRSLAQSYGDKIHYVYRDFPIEEIHPGATLAAEAGECADEQGKFWAYHDRLYLTQGVFTEEVLIELARQTNLDTRAFTQCLKSGRYTEEVKNDLEEGASVGVIGTPTFFLDGHAIPGAIPEDILRSLIDRALL